MNNIFIYLFVYFGEKKSTYWQTKGIPSIILLLLYTHILQKYKKGISVEVQTADCPYNPNLIKAKHKF